MKKILSRFLVLMVSLVVIFAQSNIAFAAKLPNYQDNLNAPNRDKDEYYFKSTKPLTSTIQLKLRKKSNYLHKGKYDLKFTVSGHNVSLGNVSMQDKSWTWDDQYLISVIDRNGKYIYSKRLKPGNIIRDDLLDLYKTVNTRNKMKTGFRLVIGGTWKNTITPINGSKNNLYLSKPKGRYSYIFTFTDQGLIEDAQNVEHFTGAQSDILLPLNNKGKVYNDRIHIRVDGRGDITFQPTAMLERNRIVTLFKLSARGHNYDVIFNASAKQSFAGVANFLNQRKLKLGDSIKFNFRRYQITPRLGRNLDHYQKGNYNLTNATGNIKFTRSGFLTDDGYVVRYTEGVYRPLY